jgi:hypothetical protein
MAKKKKVPVRSHVADNTPLQVCDRGHEVFRVTKDGEIEKDGKVITDDDAAVADCLRDWMSLCHRTHVRPAKRPNNFTPFLIQEVICDIEDDGQEDVEISVKTTRGDFTIYCQTYDRENGNLLVELGTNGKEFSIEIEPD